MPGQEFVLNSLQGEGEGGCFYNRVPVAGKDLLTYQAYCKVPAAGSVVLLLLG